MRIASTTSVPTAQSQAVCRSITSAECRPVLTPTTLRQSPLRRMSRRGRTAKLTAEQVAEIRASTETQVVLAQRYGISQPHVSRIRQGTDLAQSLELEGTSQRASKRPTTSASEMRV